jgi:hypothetical protein
MYNAATINIQHYPTSIKELSDTINLKYAIAYRDELIAANLAALQVGYITDIGCDFGNLISSCGLFGINGHGIEPSEEALELCASSGLNAIPGDYCSIISKPKEHLGPRVTPELGGENLIRAISLLNVFSAHWPNLNLREKLIETCISECDYFVVTCNKQDFKYLLNKFNLELETFIGVIQKPISRSRAALMQYGHPIFLRNSRLEMAFWQKLTKGRFFHEERITIYSRHTVIFRVK